MRYITNSRAIKGWRHKAKMSIWEEDEFGTKKFHHQNEIGTFAFVI